MIVEFLQTAVLGAAGEKPGLKVAENKKEMYELNAICIKL